METSRTGCEAAAGWCGPMGRVLARENPIRRRGGVGLCFGRAQERKEREEEETVARGRTVSEEKESKREG